MRKEGKEGKEGSLFIWVQSGLNGHGKARQKTLAPSRVSYVSDPDKSTGFVKISLLLKGK